MRIRKWIFPLLLLLPGTGLAAGFECAQPDTRNSPAPAESKLALLDEVVVTPRKPTTRTRDLSAWLKRLEGQYSYEGYVDLCGNGNAADRQPVAGKSDCVSIYNGNDVAPRSLYCVSDVRWPQVQDHSGAPVTGGESSLSPAVITYGVLPDLPGIQFMQLDSKGIATHARGQLTGDTLTATETCGLPGACRKVTRITARPDSQEIAMLIDIEVDSRRILRQAFLLHRVSNIQMSRSRYGALYRDEFFEVGKR